MPNGEFSPSIKTVLVLAMPSPFVSRSSVMRFALGTPAPARLMTTFVIQPLMPLASSGFGGALVLAPSTSPFGKTWSVRGWSSPVAKALTVIPSAAAGLPPSGQPLAGGVVIVGFREFLGGGRGGGGPK